MYEADGKLFASEDDYFDSLKVMDSYHFSIPFEYIVSHHGDDAEVATAYMEVDVNWSDSDHEYVFSWYSPDESSIDPAEGNDSIDEFFMNQVYDQALDLLASEGVPSNCVQPW